MLTKIQNYYHTIKYLQPVQIYGRVLFKLKAPFLKNKNFKPAELRLPKKEFQKPIPNHEKIDFLEKKYTFLNHSQHYPNEPDWEDRAQTQLWIYHLHYFDDLMCPRYEEKQAEHKNLMESWIDQNPVGRGNGWTPYPLSLRIVNWVKWILLNQNPSQKILDSVGQQLGFLSKRIEYHLQGNHLFVNGKALLMGGLVAGAPELYSLGLKIVSDEIPKQVLQDGAHFELTPMYHGIFLEDILDIINIMQAYGMEYPKKWNEVVDRMLFFYKHCFHPSGSIIHFNDSVDGVSKTSAELTRYARSLNITLQDHFIQTRFFEKSGLLNLKCNNYQAFVDMGNLGPDFLLSHAHADHLCFELSVGPHPIFVNLGVSEYGHNEKRLRQRGTRSHNTLAINGEDSSEVWTGFRVAKRARTQNVVWNEQGQTLSGEHDGFRRLHRDFVHHRFFEFKEKSIEVTDRILSDKRVSIEVFFHLHPNCTPAQNEKGVDIFCGDRKIVFFAHSIGKLTLEDNMYCPEFGIEQKTKSLRISLNDTGPHEIKSVIELL